MISPKVGPACPLQIPGWNFWGGSCHSDTYRFWHNCLEHTLRDMMFCILKTSHGHLSYRANRSKNQKLIQRDKTALRKYENVAVRRQSTGRTHLVDRSNYLLESSIHTSTDWTPYVDRLNLLLESLSYVSTGRSTLVDRSNPPDVRKN